MASPADKSGPAPKNAPAHDVHATTEHGGGHGGGSAFPPFNVDTFAPQLIWLTLTFVALYVLMSKVALPRIAEVVEGRRERIQGDLDAAERLKGETEKALAAYEQAHADARAKASGIAKETRDRLAAETEKERGRVDTLINVKLAEAESSIAATKKKALASVNDIAADVAGSLVAKLLGSNPAPDEVRKALAPVGE